jgi:hypothetical protein
MDDAGRAWHDDAGRPRVSLGWSQPETPAGGKVHPDGPPLELFSGSGVLEFTLEADFRQLKRDRDEESEDRPGRMVLDALDGSRTEIPLKLRTRGNFRLKKRTCSFPPLRLDLPKTKLVGTVLDGQNKLKLVTHCQNRDDYEQNLLEEYLAYRIFNLLTPVSLRVQLVRVTYVDTSGKDDPVTRYAILLESKGTMEDRLDGAFIDVAQARPSVFQPQAAGLMYLFQYLIGNVDWSIAYFHNVRCLRIGYEYLPVPYDFDWSGLVDAPYAGPHPEIDHLIRSVRQRLYRGFCSDGIDYASLMALFQEKRPAIEREIDGLPGLSERNAESAREYIQDFYQVLDSQPRFERRIVGACRSPDRG